MVFRISSQFPSPYYVTDEGRNKVRRCLFPDTSGNFNRKMDEHSVNPCKQLFYGPAAYPSSEFLNSYNVNVATAKLLDKTNCFEHPVTAAYIEMYSATPPDFGNSRLMRDYKAPDLNPTKIVDNVFKDRNDTGKKKVAEEPECVGNRDNTNKKESLSYNNLPRQNPSSNQEIETMKHNVHFVSKDPTFATADNKNLQTYNTGRRPLGDITSASLNTAQNQTQKAKTINSIHLSFKTGELPHDTSTPASKLIAPQIVAQLLTRTLKDVEPILKLFDCRSAFEFNAGHIKEAVNVPNIPADIHYVAKVEAYNQNQTKHTVYVLYGNYSLIHNLNLLNILQSSVKNSHVFILNKGYEEFSNKFPSLCV